MSTRETIGYGGLSHVSTRETIGYLEQKEVDAVRFSVRLTKLVL